MLHPGMSAGREGFDHGNASGEYGAQLMCTIGMAPSALVVLPKNLRDG